MTQPVKTKGHAPAASKSHDPGASMLMLVVIAAGVVFGDIGTSPLYAFKEALHAVSHGAPTAADAIGIASLIIWALVISVLGKYCFLVLRADNEGEGGILALASLLLPKTGTGRMLSSTTMLAIIGCCLMYGDGIITPAISVLSAMEGLKVQAPSMEPLVIPLTLAVLIGLFSVQRYGTGLIGSMFGKVMLVWFTAIAIIGVDQIFHQPDALWALNPMYAYHILMDHPGVSFAILGAVFLALTGGEAMYADMGHVGAPAIRWTFTRIVLPCLIINYLGQAATVIGDPSAASNPFYHSVPSLMLMPMIVLASAATVIASQALISGVFSLTQQAIHMTLLPRMEIRHTNGSEFGQIYIPTINWLLAIGTILVVVTFKSSEHLAGAYGISVAGTMLITTLLLYRVMVEKWKMPRTIAIIPIGIFASLDSFFLVSNSLKFFEGGWLSVGVAAFLLFLMLSWWRGMHAVREALERKSTPINEFLAQVKNISRVEGLGVFMTKVSNDVPPVLTDYIRNSCSLHKVVVLFSVVTARVPKVPGDKKVEYQLLNKDGDTAMYRVILNVGFMETPHVEPAVFVAIRHKVAEEQLLNMHVFIGHEKVVRMKSDSALDYASYVAFSIMKKLAAQVSDFFGLYKLDNVLEVVVRLDI